MDKHRYGRYRPYYDFVSSVKWDLVVIDEAHQLGFLKRGAPLRTERLAPLCRNAGNLLLLSATPSRGTHRDMVGRVSLLIPPLEARVDELLENGSLRSRLYRAVSDYIVYRRTKDHVNMFEEKRVFTNLTSLLAVVKLGDKLRLYGELGSVVSKVLRKIRGRASSLVKTIVLKRALSSPYAFLKTLNKVIVKEGAEGGVVEPRLPPTDLMVERRADDVLEALLRRVELPFELHVEVKKLLVEFEKMHREGDPAFKALALLLLYVASKPEALPAGLVGDYIVFSEYLDTVEYLYEKLINFFLDNGFERDGALENRVVEKTLRKRLEDTLSPPFKKHANALRDSIVVLRSTRGDRWVFIAKISSRNGDIVHLLPELVDVIDAERGGRVVKVLLSTDVASEGLNLHQFNIVVNYDIPWSPVRREQRLGRVYRLRQSRNCSVVDLVRDVPIDYEFYTKLVLKLLNMTEQRISSKPLEGLVELYVVERQGESSALVVSEKDLASALCRVYEEYYGDGRVLTEVLNEARVRLSRVLMEHRSLVEELTPSYSTAESVKSYVKDLTGCEDEECFSKILCKAYEALLNGPCGENLSKAVVELYEELINRRGEELDSTFTMVINDPEVEKGYFGVVDLLYNGEVRFSTPILVLFRKGVPTVVHGLELLNTLVDYLKEGHLRFIKLPTGASGVDYREFGDFVKLFLDKINFRFNERVGLKDNELLKIVQQQKPIYIELSFKLKTPLIRVLGVQGLVDYEAFRTGLPADVREWMEVESVNLIRDLFRAKGCRVLEINIGEYKPYDLLVECPTEGGFVKYMVEVKSHLKRVLVAELTPNETQLAEENPRNYVVCNVSGLENRDKSTWITICDLYENVEKDVVTKTREERVARIYFAR